MQNSGKRQAGLRLRMIFGIVVPVLISFSFMDYYFLQRLTQKAGLTSEAAGALMPPVLIVSGVCFLVVAAAVLLTARAFIKPLKMLTIYAEKLADGDTAFKVETVKRNDEFGQLGRSVRRIQVSLIKMALILNHAAGDILRGNLSVQADAASYPGAFGGIMEGSNKSNDSIRTLIEHIRDAAVNVAAESEQLSAGAQSLAQSSTEQASSIEQIAVTVGEVLDITRTNADNAAKTKGLSDEASRDAAEGSQKMTQLIDALDGISRSSADIAGVIKIIEDIAFQTNILALNASVEAARAGIHGKGFAVVAQEVRVLAEKSSKAAKETNDLLSESIQSAKKGLSLGTEMANMLTAMTENIGRSAAAVTDIAAQCVRQVDTIEDVNMGLRQVSQTVQSNTATAQESAASCHEMVVQSEALTALVSHYKIKVERVVSSPTGFDENDY